MNNGIEKDPILGRYFDSPEKKAKWLFRIKIAYILWIVFVTLGIIALMVIYYLK